MTTRIVDAHDRQRYDHVKAVTPFDQVEPFRFSVDVPINDLDAGQYLLTLDLKEGSSTVRRQLRFSVR